jgi:hypothetical protein
MAKHDIIDYPTIKVNIKDIKLDGDNPNLMDDDMEKRLGHSMEEFGNTQDIIIDKNTMILHEENNKHKD